MPEPRRTGTKEWAKTNINISNGCSNDCKYCYARQMAERFRRTTEDTWHTEIIDEAKITKNYRKVNNDDPSVYDVMTPTTHDLTAATIDGMVIVLKKVLAAGNSVVIVSKPRLEYIQRLVEELRPWKAQIVFRFTITSINDNLMAYWEPNAPRLNERLQALQYAFDNGFTTSVSAEPSLYLPDSVRLVLMFEPFVSETIWIGKMNQTGTRVHVHNDEDVMMLNDVKAGQTDDMVYEVYQALKNHPKVRWKDSIKETLQKKFNITV